MSGFQFNLKRKENPSGNPGGKGIKIALGKKPLPSKGLKKTGTIAKKALNNSDDESDDEGKVVSIDAFDSKKGGAIAGNQAVSLKAKVAPLVIEPSDLKSTIDHKRRKVYTPNSEQDESKLREMEELERKNKLQYGITNFSKAETSIDSTASNVVAPKDDKIEPIVSKDERIRQSLLKGENLQPETVIVQDDESFQRALEDAPDEDSEEEYNRVPVEQFGAALLRGMGWKPDHSKSKTSKSPTNAENIIKNRKQGVLVGIGAKPVEADLMEDIVGKRVTKFEIPLARRDRETGEIIRE
ncbi:DExH-box splicing factor binding site-domain-containing protein [Scheffersomyces xylosifermentans]|uniref:DExH-box splicing factor binding site-domain-containing protein n=1 Tax=Scheffersomyces xylosifermentans TaxID=1304137 RepID=UPI00315DACAE